MRELLRRIQEMDGIEGSLWELKCALDGGDTSRAAYWASVLQKEMSEIALELTTTATRLLSAYEARYDSEDD